MGKISGQSLSEQYWALTLFHRQRIYSAVPVNELPDWQVLAEGISPAERAGQHARLAFSTELDRTPTINVFTASPPEIEQQLAWRRMHVEFTDIPLQSAVKLFNRQNRLQIAIADPALGERRISGIYWLVDPEGFVRLLKSGLSLKVDESSDRVTLRPE